MNPVRLKVVLLAGAVIKIAAAFGLMVLGAITTIFTDPTSSDGSGSHAFAQTYYRSSFFPSE